LSFTAAPGKTHLPAVLFNSWDFFAFFLAVYAMYVVLARPAQRALLLGASWLFYGAWDWRFLSLLLISTIVDFSVGRHLEDIDEGEDSDRRRKRWLMVSVFTNLGILGFFKYFGFFVESAEGLLALVGLKAHLPTLKIVLPVGISFYTFQTMAYTIDVYRRRMPAVRELSLFALYVSYFPQLVAGPIERPQTLIPQLRAPKKVDAEMLRTGLLMIFLGLVRKVGIADVVAPTVDLIYEAPESASSSALVLGTVLFAIQIYCDFSGYSYIARGVSRLLGIELMENFRHPYFATNITDFWRRWHISLSSWLRDYLYIPLGGNRGSRAFVYRNLFLTMLLGGLWHGAAWTFVVWGAIHGLALAIHKAWMEAWGRDRKTDPGPLRLRNFPQQLFGWLLTMLVVLGAWVFFRAGNFADAIEVYKGIFELRGGYDPFKVLLTGGMAAWVLFIDLPQSRSGDPANLLRQPWFTRGLCYATFTLLMLLLERADNAAFIYFQF
jgi:D-alanyl-lipoteichoic acid acyltransferase DltB (MBOAT superfamily)